MAVPNSNYTNELIAATFEEAAKVAYDQVYQATPLLDWLYRHQQPASGGTKVTIPLLYAQSGRSAFFTTGSSLTLAQSDQITRASYSWKNIACPVLIYEQDIMQNSGEAQIVDLAKEKLEEAKSDLADTLMDALTATSADTSKLDSIVLICDQTTTIGEIAPGTYTWWKAQLSNGSSAALTVGAMETIFNDCSEGKGGGPPTDLFAAQNMVESYKKLAGDYGRISLDGRGGEVADLGFEKCYFRGRPMWMETYLSDGYILFLNHNFLKLRPHTRNAGRWITEVKPVPATPGATEHTFWGMFTLAVRRRKSLGCMYGYAAVT